MVQPSASVALPSSQASSDALAPSPQVLVHTLVAPKPPVQSYPKFSTQLLEQPLVSSPSPSSQASWASRTPSSQVPQSDRSHWQVAGVLQTAVPLSKVVPREALRLRHVGMPEAPSHSSIGASTVKSPQ